jgi:YVTN family beta-propeller protein
MVISRRAFLTLPAIAATACSRSEPAFNGYAFIANQAGGAIAAVDLGVMAVAKHISIEGSPSQVLSAATRPAVYALTPETGTVHEIRTDTLKFVRKITAAPKVDAMHLAPDETALYLLTRDSRTLTAIKLDDLSIAWRMTLPEEPVDLALSSDGKTAAVTSATTIRLLSLKERSVGEPLGRANYGQVKFLSDGKSLVVADLDQRQISVYRVPNPRLIAHLPIAVRPENLAFNRDGGQLFVTGAGGDSVVVIYPYDIPEVAETILVGHAPAMMTASSSMLFITSPTSGDVSVLNISTHKVIAVVPVGTDPGQVAITPDEQLALVLNGEPGNVTVLNIDAIQPGRNKANALVTVIPVGSRPVSAAMHSV